KDDLALLVEGTEGDPLGVDVETNVKHETPPKAEERDNQRPWFHVTRPTEASFIVSHRLQLLPRALWRPGQFDAATPRSLLDRCHPRPVNAYLPRRRPQAFPGRTDPACSGDPAVWITLCLGVLPQRGAPCTRGANLG